MGLHRLALAIANFANTIWARSYHVEIPALDSSSGFPLDFINGPSYTSSPGVLLTENPRPYF